MTYKPLISIIINCFNGEKYLDECLKSIISQTYTNYEVIFWDNLSNDNSKLIYSKIKDNRFKYFNNNKHVSLYAARNNAIKVCQGDYIAFLDVDDLWLPEKLAKQVVYIQKNPTIGFCYSGFLFLSQKTGIKKSAYNNKTLKSGRLTSNLLKKYNIGLLTLMVNKSIIDVNQIKFDNRFTIMGDLDFVLRLSKVSNGIAIKKDLAIYRNHTENLSLKIDQTVEERKIWQDEAVSKLTFSRKEILPFIKETKYLEFTENIKLNKLAKNIKELFELDGIFFLKGIILLIFLIRKNIFKFLKN
tara:strand:- start:2710 stop:3609 length:900 start_codon:yes stop_codon:yes gene_type:complete